MQPPEEIQSSIVNPFLLFFRHWHLHFCRRHGDAMGHQVLQRSAHDGRTRRECAVWASVPEGAIHVHLPERLGLPETSLLQRRQLRDAAAGRLPVAAQRLSAAVGFASPPGRCSLDSICNPLDDPCVARQRWCGCLVRSFDLIRCRCLLLIIRLLQSFIWCLESWSRNRFRCAVTYQACTFPILVNFGKDWLASDNRNNLFPSTSCRVSCSNTTASGTNKKPVDAYEQFEYAYIPSIRTLLCLIIIFFIFQLLLLIKNGIWTEIHSTYIRLQFRSSLARNKILHDLNYLSFGPL